MNILSYSPCIGWSYTAHSSSWNFHTRHTFPQAKYSLLCTDHKRSSCMKYNSDWSGCNWYTVFRKATISFYIWDSQCYCTTNSPSISQCIEYSRSHQGDNLMSIADIWFDCIVCSFSQSYSRCTFLGSERNVPDIIDKFLISYIFCSCPANKGNTLYYCQWNTLINMPNIELNCIGCIYPQDDSGILQLLISYGRNNNPYVL